MDLIAFNNQNNELIRKYINDNYGDIPRCRGIRFMKLEKKVDDKPNIDVTDLFCCEDKKDYNESISMFNKYAGQDIIYIHTRCGDCGLGYNSEESNYSYYGAKEWEEKYKDLFLEHITDVFDETYCTHYFKAVIDDNYKTIIKNGKK